MLTITNEQDHTPGGSKSVFLNPYDDKVRLFDGYDLNRSSSWLLTTFVYIPSDMTGSAFFIVLADLDIEGGNITWAIQLDMNVANGTINDDIGGRSLPLITDRWAEIRAEIDLGADWVRIFYDDALLSEYPWSDGFRSLQIRAIDLFSNSATGFFYDDFSFCAADDLGIPPVPTTSGVGLLLAAAVVMVAGAKRLKDRKGRSSAPLAASG